jgi:hypothetical protein
MLGARFLVRHLHRKSGTFEVRVKRVGKVVLRTASEDADAFTQVFTQGQYDFTYHPQWQRVRNRYEAIVGRGHRP